MPTNAERLAEVPFFALLDDEERAQLAERLDVVKLAAGQSVFAAGDPGDSPYVVRSGEVDIFFENDTGDEILERAGPGHFFGEISLLDDGPRTASARVTDDLEALEVDRGDLDEFLGLHPEAFGVNLEAEFEIARLHEKVDHMHGKILERLSNIERSGGRPA